MTAWRQGKLQNGDAPVLSNIEALVSFSFVWCVCVIIGRKIMVWPGSCQGKCTRQRSCRIAMEGFVTEKISSAGFCFVSKGEVVVMRFVDLCLEGKYKNNLLCNVLREAKYLS